MKNKNLITLSLVLMILTAGLSGKAAITIYFNMDGLPGDGNQVAGHSGDSVVSAFSWSVATNTPASPAFTLSFQKNLAVNSPALAADCAHGKVTDDATLTCYASNGGPSPAAFYWLSLSNVVVTAVSVGSSGTAPVENISLQFNSITWTYVPQNPDGSLGTPVVTSYP